MASLSHQLKELAADYSRVLAQKFEGNLCAVVLFGSVARDEARETSDIDILLIFNDLPTGRTGRLELLGEIPPAIEQRLETLREQGIYTDFIAHVKSLAELQTRRSPFLYEVCHDGIVLYDPKGHFASLRDGILSHMKSLGSQWKQHGRFRYLDLKPDYQPGDIFEL